MEVIHFHEFLVVEVDVTVGNIFALTLKTPLESESGTTINTNF